MSCVKRQRVHKLQKIAIKYLKIISYSNWTCKYLIMSTEVFYYKVISLNRQKYKQRSLQHTTDFQYGWIQYVSNNIVKQAAVDPC